MTPEQKQLGLARIRRWPREQIDAAACLASKEQAFLVEAAAELDIRPAPDWVPGRNVIEIP